MKLKIVLFIITIISLIEAVKAQTIVIDNLNSKIAIKNKLTFLEDSTNQLTFEEVEKSTKFKPIKSDIPNFGISNNSFWLKLLVKNITNRNIFLLQISQPGLDEIECYHYNNSVKGSLVVDYAGEYLPFKNRLFYDANYIFRVEFQKDSLCEIFFKVKARDNIQVPMFIGTTEVIFESNKIKDSLAGIYTGIMIVMLIYNLFIFFTVKDESYLYYVIYIACVMLTQAGIQGYAFQYLYPNLPWLAQYSSFILPPLVGIAGLYFMRVFLNTRQFLPRLAKVQHIFTLGYILAFVLSLFGMYSAGFILIEVCAAGVAFYMISVAYIIHRKGYRPATFFLYAWIFFLIGVSLYVMKDLGILPYTNFTFYSMPIGSAIEVVLLSFALADRINILKKEKEQSQLQALQMLQQNEKLIKEQNIFLEQKVHERTLELEEANNELNTTLNNLKDTQTQLVNAEKMASLGQLTAGIAHEINNPINFVGANVKPLKMDVADLLDIIKRYEGLDANDTNLQEKIDSINEFKERLDIDYVRQEIDILLNGIEEGARRTTEIVYGLKNFARLDESDVKEADVNEGINSTLVLLRSNIQGNIEVIKNLADLPMIECLPGKLNQVFMNLFSNALYALKEKKSEKEEYLKISSYELNDKVIIEIEDTGIGMSPEVKAKIFEPFFTTKDVGEGTGLGMSIVFKIVESHQAKLEVESELGVGTKFKLILNKKLELNLN
jgi:signal transduction histidine kinase